MVIDALNRHGLLRQYISTHRIRFTFTLLWIMESIISLEDKRILMIGEKWDMPVLIAELYNVEPENMILTTFNEAGTSTKVFSKSRKEDITVPFEKLDAELDLWPVESGSIDAIFCFEVVEHFPLGPVTFNSEVARVLKPKGRLFLSTPNGASLTNVAKIIRHDQPANYIKYIAPGGPITHVLEHSPNTLRAQILKGGDLKIVKHRTFSPYGNERTYADIVSDCGVYEFLVKHGYNPHWFGDTHFLEITRADSPVPSVPIPAVPELPSQGASIPVSDKASLQWALKPAGRDVMQESIAGVETLNRHGLWSSAKASEQIRLGYTIAQLKGAMDFSSGRVLIIGDSWDMAVLAVELLNVDSSRITVAATGAMTYPAPSFLSRDLGRKTVTLSHESFDVATEAWPYESGAFDAILCFGVVEHFELGPTTFVEEAGRVLAPGGQGRMFLTSPNSGALVNLWKISQAEIPALNVKYQGVGKKITNVLEYAPKFLAWWLTVGGFLEMVDHHTFSPYEQLEDKAQVILRDDALLKKVLDYGMQPKWMGEVHWIQLQSGDRA